MIVYKAYKFKLNPTKEQTILLNKSFGSSRFIYNYYLDKKKSMYEKDNKNYLLVDMKKDLKVLYTEYEWLKEVDSTLLRTTLEHLDKAFEDFYKKKTGFPKYKSKLSKNSYTTTCIRSSYKGNEYENIKLDLKSRTIKLPKVGNVMIQGYRNLKENKFKIKNATISKECNKYYVSLCVEEELTPKTFILKNVIGIDLGVKDLVVTSDGLKYKALDNIKKYDKKLKGLQKWLSRSQKGSKNRNKIILKIQRVYQKIRNAKKYYNHLISKQLVENNDIIFTETLNIKNMLQKSTHTLSHKIQNSSFYDLQRKIEYKSKWQNKQFIHVNSYYPSSQLCSKCNRKNEKVKDLNVRKWTCDICGNENDRDINASENILFEGLRIYMKNKLSY